VTVEPVLDGRGRIALLVERRCNGGVERPPLDLAPPGPQTLQEELPQQRW
jgi:hypothetical protein